MAAFTIGGVAAGLLMASRTIEHTELASIETRIVPSLHGRVTVYVPLVDWQVELLDHRVPVNVILELRGIDRSSAGTSISSRDAARRSVAQVRRDSHAVVRDAIERGVVVGSIGGIIGGLIGGCVIAAVVLRRRWLVTGAGIGVIVTGAVMVVSIVTLSGLDERRIDPTTLGAGGAAELPQVLQFARQLLVVGDEYERHYETALRSVAELTELTRRAGGPTTRSAFVVSDIHDNVFILDAFSSFAGDRTVFAVGDYGQVGAKVEQRTAGRIAGLGGKVVAVSGNHDSAPYMDAMRREGAQVLEGDVVKGNAVGTGVVEVDDFRVAGYRDPLERRHGRNRGHVLRVYGDAYQRQVDDLIAWFEALDTRPDIVLVHQHGFAHRLIRHLQRTDPKGAPPIAIFTGHDHNPHVDQYDDGRYVLVDGGTLGAGGPFAIGQQSASFAKVDFTARRIVSVDIVSIDPTSGDASSDRIPIKHDEP